MNNAGMPLQYVETRRGQRGRPVSEVVTDRMATIVDEMSLHTAHAITARHLFYRMLGRGLPKTENAYHLLLSDLLKLRRSGDVAWSAIEDGTRLKTRWVGYGDLAEAANEWQRTYRRDIWRMNSAACEVWTESRGLLTTINEVAGERGVTTLGVGGFNSASVGWETAQAVQKVLWRDRDFYIFHFGDFDPAGKNIGASAEREIRWHLTDEEVRPAQPADWSVQDYLDWGGYQDQFHFEVLALTREQVREYNLPSAPAKTDSKTGKVRGGAAAQWRDEDGTTELDALDPDILQDLVREAIESIIDPGLLDKVDAAEESEKDIIGRMIATMKGPSE